MFVERCTNGLVVHTPAKINLALEILGRQANGYHEVETLLVPVRLFDTLTYYPSPGSLRFSLRFANGSRTAAFDCPADENLAVKAVRLLAQQSGRELGGQLTLVKRIPVQAGLGGGSSDAAAALVAANRAWQLGYHRQQLEQFARQLGTDVPFFVRGGAALGTGRGERLSPAAIPAGLPIVLVQPPVGLSTPKVFESLDLAMGEAKQNITGRCRQLVEHLQSGRPIAGARLLIRNCLQQAAERMCDWIQRASAAMDNLPVIAHQMTGSGSGYFGICRSWREAHIVASRLRGQPWRFVVATQTCR